MKLELKHLQTQVGITFVYVTHDQEEALTMSTRIALMRAGRIEQLGSPTEIYDRPASRYVADFIGETNLLQGRLRDVSAGGAVLEVAGHALRVQPPAGAVAGQDVWLSVRPEVLEILPDGTAPPHYNVMHGTVEEGIYAGAVTKLRLRLASGATLVLHAAPTGVSAVPGQPARVGWPVERGVCLAG
jgi:spermidine/putrescine transport system ATP-binding protein